ncbi:MAG: HAMP domain-containing sensor histidine kinase [Chloroflexi bacterium]|nr:HAMP domain-containing sensor histidine kinase [Chloroflexota bacterium]
MFASLRSRLWLTYALSILTALLVVAVIFLIYLLDNPLVYRQTKIRLSSAQGFLLAKQSTWANLPAAQLQSTLIAQAQELDVRLLLVNPQRKVFFDTQDESGNSLEIRPLYRLFRLNQVLTDSKGRPWLYVTRRLDNGNTLVLAALRPKVSFWTIFTDELVPPLFWGGALGLILALMLAYWMARWVADPLQQVVNATRQFSGDQAKPLAIKGPQEVQALVDAFNQMTARVQSSQQAQREFVANVSHELKTPLTSIQGFSQAILDGTAASAEDQKQSAQVIYDEAARMHRLVLDLLDLARLDAGIANLKQTPVDLPALLNSVGERFALQARQNNISLEIHASALPAITGDGDRLAQVFTNLVDNALKFTPAGGRVAVEASQTGSSIEICITDSGAGIPPSAIPHVFERFYQVDTSRQGGKQHGAGLGLAIVHEIVRAHHGSLTVRSSPGQGSQFTVQLPVGAGDKYS